MRIYNLVFCWLIGLLVLPASLCAQHGLGLHYLPQTFQSSYTNPAFIQQARFQLTLPVLIPPTDAGIYHSGFTLNDMVIDINETPLRFDPDKLLAALSDDNFVQMRTRIAPVGFSFKIKDIQIGFHTAVRIDGFFGYPAGLPTLAWTGNAPFIDQAVDIAPDFQLMGYRETGLQVAFPLGDKLILGARLNYLNGVGVISSAPSASELSLYTDPEYYQLTLSTDYVVRMGTSLDTDLGAYADLESLINGDSTLDEPEFTADVASLASFTRNPGVGIDLGISYRPIERLQVNASVINLGAISWTHNSQQWGSQGEVSFIGVDPFAELEGTLDGEEISTVVENSLDTYLDSALATFLPNNEGSSFRTALPVRFYLSGRYEVLGPLVIGATYSGESFRGRFNSLFALYAGLNFKRWLTLGSTLTFDQRYGNMLGAHVRLNLGPLQIYSSVGNLFPLFRPETAQAVSFAIGTNWTFGRKDKGKEKNETDR